MRTHERRRTATAGARVGRATSLGQDAECRPTGGNWRTSAGARTPGYRLRTPRGFGARKASSSAQGHSHTGGDVADDECRGDPRHGVPRRDHPGRWLRIVTGHALRRKVLEEAPPPANEVRAHERPDPVRPMTRAPCPICRVTQSRRRLLPGWWGSLDHQLDPNPGAEGEASTMSPMFLVERHLLARGCRPVQDILDRHGLRPCVTACRRHVHHLPGEVRSPRKLAISECLGRDGAGRLAFARGVRCRTCLHHGSAGHPCEDGRVPSHRTDAKSEQFTVRLPNSAGRSAPA